MDPQAPHRGMRIFTLVAIGQIVSLTGTNLTGFVLGIWVFQRTGSATQFALINLAAMAPSIFVAPLIGALVDRWDRRWVMILSDTVAGVFTLTIALLFFTGRLEIWHIYIAMGLRSTANGFRSPAYMASISLLVPQEQLGRANGIVQMGQNSRYLIAPILGGWLMGVIGVAGVVLVDCATFLFAVSTCLLVRFPKPQASDQAQQGSLLQESLVGWKYVAARPGLLGMMLVSALSNYAQIVTDTVLSPMLLLGNSSPVMVGSVVSIGGIGMVIGSLLMSVWKGPKRLIWGVLGSKFIVGISIILVGIFQPAPLIAAAVFCYYFPFPMTNGYGYAIWQRKVSPEVQGRVFAILTAISLCMTPLALVTAGPLADRVFGPLLTKTGPLAPSLGWIMGVGPGRGIGLLISVMGLAVLLIATAGTLYPRLRNIEDELPDAIHIQVQESTGAGQTKF